MAATAALCAATVTGGQASGATLRWLGTASSSWNDANNWYDDTNAVNALPAPGDDLRFASTTGTRAMMSDIPDMTVQSMTFSGLGYSLVAGSTITMDGINPQVISNTTGSSSITMEFLGTLAVNKATEIQVNGAGGNNRIQISGDVSGAGGINKTGQGTLRIGGTAKSYTGNTVVSTGTLDMAANALTSGAGKGDVYVSTGATLVLNNTDLGINGLNGSGSVSKVTTSSKTFTIGNGNADGIYTGNISLGGGSGNNLTKVGTGTQILGATSVAGSAAAINVNGGKLYLNGATSAAKMIVSSGATVGGTGIVTLSSTLTLNAGSTLNVAIGGNTAGTYGQIHTAGAMTIDPTTVLSASLNSYSPVQTDVLFILVRDDAAAFTNLFANTAEGASVDLGNGLSARITYQANWAGSEIASTLTGGNDVALYNLVVADIPEPASLTLCAAGILILVRRKRQ